MTLYRRLIALTTLITLVLIMLGAYVRLSDAGLGCPDWPGCYGKLTPAQALADISKAVQAQGGDHGPVSMTKAWKEMAHRYIAMLIGLAILAIAYLSIRHRLLLRQSPLLPLALLATVVVQGLFGKWTVTLLLKPAIVTGHLIGGMLTFALLVWLWQRQSHGPRPVDAEPVVAMTPALVLGLVILSLQIVLGGWVSTNYAALACTDLPTCQGQWWPPSNFADAFHVIRELGKTGQGAQIDSQALTAIHLSHRVGAVIAASYLLWLGAKSSRVIELAWLGRALIVLVLVQVLLGISNVWFSLPLAVAVSHNGVAALLVAVLVMLNFRAFEARKQI